MFPINALKFFFALFLAPVVFTSCGFWQDSQNENIDSNAFAAEEQAGEIPFETEEPEIFQAEIVLTVYSNGEKTERVIKAARAREKFRYDYPNETSFLQTGENEVFLLETQRKIYTQSLPADAELPAAAGETLKDFLTTEWLSENRGARFESLGADGGLAKYRVRAEGGFNSEIIIYVDENIKLPVKQEFFLTGGEQKTLVSAVEIKSLKLEADDAAFQIPADYKRVSADEFQKIIKEKSSDAKK